MQGTFFKRAMAYLGLAADEYDDLEDDEEDAPRVARQTVRPSADEPVAEPRGATIRSIVRDPQAGRAPLIRPVAPEASARVHVIAPREFGDAREIADRVMANQPVIVNLQAVERDLMRRMIDFCSGVAYALNGRMERVADRVFLVTPSNVKVSAEERQRLQEDGLIRS
jgi:cell division inhibitor SepF